ncbi:MAG: helix-hairpin-helix domain-containing protein [Bacteroidetes bacterium]|nr:helix-hairpin-helix domain-containing protein [Bacteroidota bacterium]
MDQWREKVQSLIAMDTLMIPGGKVPDLKPFLFDPNTLSLQEFDSMGLNKRLSTTILNYREKGGRFRVKSDLKKIYGFTDELFDMLYNYIDLPETYTQLNKDYTARQTPHEQTQREESSPLAQIDINIANANDLKTIRGIGDVLSTRIVSFRDALGGFSSIEQLGEVYGLNDTVLVLVVKQFFVADDFTPMQINLSGVSEEILKKHPYVDYRMARVISSFSRQHQIQDVNDLKEIKIMTDSLFNKIAPYLYVSILQDSVP